MPEQADQPVAKVPSLEQHEDHHRDHEAGCSQRTDDRAEPCEGRIACELLRGKHDRPRGRLWQHVRLPEIAPDALDGLLQLLHGPAPSGDAHVGNLGQDVDPVAGKVLGQMV